MFAPATPRIDSVVRAIGRCVSPITARSVLTAALNRIGMSEQQLEREGVSPGLITEIQRGIDLFSKDALGKQDCTNQLHALAREVRNAQGASVEVKITDEDAVVEARVHARTLASGLGFEAHDCIKIVTAVSELARNIHRYAGSGTITLRTVMSPRVGLEVVAVDRGPGIADLKSVLSGTYKSTTGMGLGLRGCQRLMDEFTIDTGPGRGTRVRACKLR